MCGCEMRKIKAGACKVVLGLPNVHPETSEVERVKLLVGSDCREDFFLDRGGFRLDSVKDGRIKHVDTGVDSVADELHRLLDESIDHCRIWFGDNDTICGRLSDLCDLWVSENFLPLVQITKHTMIDPSLP